MTRKEKIESYSKAFDKLTDALKKFPQEMWFYKPAPGKWSIHEIIIHIADSEAHSYCRARKFIVEPGSAIMAYAQDEWAKKLDYHSQSTSEALELFRILRRNTYNIIKDLPDEVWANTIDHPENGRMTMDDWLNIYEEHIPVHINQMERTFVEWQKSR